MHCGLKNEIALISLCKPILFDLFSLPLHSLSLNRSSTNAFISLLSRILYYDFSNGSELKSLQAKPEQLQSHSNVCIQRETCKHSKRSILKSVRDFQLLAQVRYHANRIAISITLFNSPHLNQFSLKFQLLW